MSDWTKQTEELVNTWTNSQKQMWDNWLGAMEKMGNDAAMKTFEDERQKIVDNWQASVKKGLEAQAEWARMWTDSLASNKETPKPMLEWAKQFQSMMKSWTQSQEELSQVWFDMMKKLDTGKMSETLEAQSKQLISAWQEAVDKSLEAQREMAQLWTEAGAKAVPSRKKS